MGYSCAYITGEIMLLKKLRKATWKHRCDWANGCRKWVKYWYQPKDWYYCKIHGPKFERRNQHLDTKLRKKERQKKLMVSNYKSMKTKRKVVTARVLKLRVNATWAELAFNDKMKQACPVQFKFQRGFIKGGYFAIVDFYIPSRKICIEIDGEYHREPEQQRKDRHRDNWLRTVRKLKVRRITNEQAIKMTIQEVRHLVAL